MSTDGTQKRAFEREMIQTEALVVEMRESGGKSVTGKTRNISVGGAFIETPERMPIGTELQVFIGSSRSSLALRAMAVVAHTEDSGLGLSFLDSDDESRQYVASFIAHFRHTP